MRADCRRLLRTFSLKYLLLDNVCHTIELNYTDRLVLVNNSYIKVDSPPPLNGAESTSDKEALAK